MKRVNRNHNVIRIPGESWEGLVRRRCIDHQDPDKIEEPKMSKLVSIAIVTAMWTTILAGILWMVLLNAGCAAPTVIANKGSVASAGLSEDLDTAHTEISTAAPHADPVGKEHLKSADAAIGSGKQKLPAINAGLAQVAPLEAENTKLKKEFFSPRQRGLFLVVGLSVAGLGIVLTVLYFATPFGAPVGAFCAMAFHVLTLGVFKIAHRIAFGIESNVATAKAGTRAAPIVITKNP